MTLFPINRLSVTAHPCAACRYATGPVLRCVERGWHLADGDTRIDAAHAVDQTDPAGLNMRGQASRGGHDTPADAITTTLLRELHRGTLRVV